MRVTTSLRLLGLGCLGLLLAACSIFPLSPSLDLTVQAAPYLSPTIDIPYAFATLSANALGGSADCTYTLGQWNGANGGYSTIDQSSGTLPSSGTLSFDLDSLLGLAVGSTAIDGAYRLTFSVLGGKDQSGNSVPVPFLTKSVRFSVFTGQGPEIFMATPSAINVSSTTGSAALTLTGAGFASGDAVASTSPTTSAVTSSTFVGPLEMTAKITTTSLTAGSLLTLDVTTSAGGTSPSYSMPLIGTLALASIVPSYGSNTNSRQGIVVTGAWLGDWTKVVVTGPNGAPAPMTIDYSSGITNTSTGASYIAGYLDLTQLSAGTGTLTVTNPDGSTSSIAFTVDN